MKRIVRGNDFTMRIPVVKIVDGEKVAFPLPGCTDIMVRLCSAYRRLELAHTIDAKEDNVIVARVEGDRIPLGTYALEVRGKIFGNDWRSNEYEQVAIVDRNADADTELGNTDEGENSVEMDTAVVYLPPSAELSALINEARETNTNFKALDETVKKSEEATSKAVADCEEASTGAGNVNAVLNGNVLTVTDRQGAAKSVNLTDSDEHVTVNVTTDVKDASVAGIKLSVYINDAQDYHLYTTDSNGQAEFTVTKGSTYRVVFPYVKGCSPIDPVRHVAAVGNRIIDARYKAEVDKSERVIVSVKKAEDANDTPMPWEGVDVYLTVGRSKTTYVTGKDGTVEFDVPDGKAYTVSVDDVEGMYEQNGLTEVSRTASSPDFRFSCVFRAYESGVFLIDDNNRQWTFTDWEASGNDNARLTFVCIKTKETQQFKGDIYVDIDRIAVPAKNPKKEWGSQYAYTSVPLNGEDKSSPGYYTFAYNGLYCTQNIVNEAEKQGGTDIAFASYCYAQTIKQGGKTWQGYGPTLWQWRLFWQNVSMILLAVSKKYPDSSINVGDIGMRVWSITQSSATNAWCIESGTFVTPKEKYNSYAAIPFFFKL